MSWFIPNVSNYRRYCRSNALYNYLYRWQHIILAIIIIWLAAPKNCSRCNLCPHLLQGCRICGKWHIGRGLPRSIMTPSLPPRLSNILSNLPRASNSCGKLVGKITASHAHTSVFHGHLPRRFRHRNQPTTKSSANRFYKNIFLILRRQNHLSPLPTMLHNRSTNHASYFRFVIRSRQHKHNSPHFSLPEIRRN